MKVVQLYEVARTAHLERIDGDDEVILLYREKRYDFDDTVAGRAKPLRAGLVSSVLYALRNDTDLIEVNEPLVTRAAVRSLAFVWASRARARLRRRPAPRVVAYAIANVSSSDLRRHLPPKARVKFEIRRPLAGLVWMTLDRIAYGTADAQELYRREFSERPRMVSRRIEALPVAAPRREAEGTAGAPTVLFLGDLSPRKGFPDVMAAWHTVRTAVPDARLSIVGRGVGAQEAVDRASRDDRITVLLDPPREKVYAELDTARVLVLPSRRMPLWREQVGLPIVEGLAHGCVVVTTDETGIAAWLRENGHHVIAEREVDKELGPAIVAAVRSKLTAADVREGLPAVDGRSGARRWLYEGDED